MAFANHLWSGSPATWMQMNIGRLREYMYICIEQAHSQVRRVSRRRLLARLHSSMASSHVKSKNNVYMNVVVYVCMHAFMPMQVGIQEARLSRLIQQESTCLIYNPNSLCDVHMPMYMHHLHRAYGSHQDCDTRSITDTPGTPDRRHNRSNGHAGHTGHTM